MKTSNITLKIFYSKDLSFSTSFVGLLWVCVCRTTCSEYCVTGFLKSQKNIEKRKNIGQASLSFFYFLFSMFQSVLQCSQEENAMHIFKQTLFSGQDWWAQKVETSPDYLCLNINNLYCLFEILDLDFFLLPAYAWHVSIFFYFLFLFIILRCMNACDCEYKSTKNYIN